MRIKVYGKAHLEGVAKKSGNPYNINQVHSLGKARGVEGQAALTLPEEALLFPFSAEKGTGKTELLAAIGALCGIKTSD